MPDTTKYKSVSVPQETYQILSMLSKTLLEVPITISKTIEHLAKKEEKRVNGSSKA